MDKEFVTYEQAVALNELKYDGDYNYTYTVDKHLWYGDVKADGVSTLAAPLKQQVFRWFREKYNLKSCIMFRHSMEDDKEYYDWLIKGQEVIYRHFITYEEAENACIDKLIELVNN
jgi:hypothetical protein